MLDLITKSKTRKKILTLLFANPGQDYYLSEIAKIINASVGNCQRELDLMVKKGILNTTRKANLKIYSVNRQNPLYEELSSIINKTLGIETSLKSLVEKFSKIKFAFIFGSLAKKDFTAGSDVDLFLIGQVDEKKLIPALNSLQNLLGREINYHLYCEKEFKQKSKTNSFLQNITKNYILLTKNQDEFKRLLK